MLNRAELAPVRVRHTLKFRLLQVRRVQRVTPYLVCVTLAGEDLHDFESASFDDHVKLFIPPPGEARPAEPMVTPTGLVFPEGQPRPVLRDYTPRRFDRAARELDIEFALHEAGPATEWAMQAQVGQYLGVGGPRGSLVIPTGYDWHLLIGDDTALPAIARRVAELPAGTRVAVVAEVANESARISFDSQAEVYSTWCYREAVLRGGSTLLEAVRETYLPPGEGFVWAAGELATIRAVRQHLCEERGIDKSRIRAASYWQRGEADAHQSIND